ncbi:TonB-dependent receptor [Terriglobus aquaticus]|uniref:TonB-dependent receptor domain-containing protein n=1 Tax=Terriglobus aquaticus TaxID=940139 RepID=A0ABW9KIT9_9BACT|nr:TonB-dependent receptor [Terriglobus aquaticus]
MARRCSLQLAAILVIPSAALAQTVTGSVRGTVLDPTGAAIVGAQVTAINTATGVATAAKTEKNGDYSLRFLQIGSYTITVTAPGFAEAKYGPFQLSIDQTAKIDIPLSVSGNSATVEVDTGTQPILETEAPTLGETFTTNAINSLPLNGRDFSQLTVFTPGAISTNYGAFGGQNSIERSTGADNEPNVNGNRQQSNNYLLDGQEINENLNNTIGYSPSPDALDQVRVIAANANAEFGNVNGGDVVMVTKSGTNSFHGSVFGFLENQNLNANSWTNKRSGTPINPYTQAIFGGTLGGPIFRDKVFFFMDYQGARQHSGGLGTTHVAPAALRTGDFSALLRGSSPIQLYNTQNAGGPVPYANNQLPITNPVARFLFSHPEVYPLPNIPGASDDPLSQVDNYSGLSKSYQRNDQGDIKIDWHFRLKDVLSGRYTQGIAQDATTAVPLAVQFPSASDYPDHLFTTTWTHTFSPSVVNELRASYSRIRFNSGVTTDPSGIFGLNGNQVVGIPSAAQQTAGFSAQQFSTGSISNFGANPTPEIFIDNVFQYADNLTWQRGRHLFKFGAQITRYQQNSFYPGNNGVLGYFQYTGQFTADPSSSSTNIPFADFVTNNVYEAAVGQVVGRTGQRQYRDAYFAQDDFKVSDKLTLNLGVRYEYDQPIYEVNNKQANLNLQTAAIEYAGVNGNSRALYNPTYTNIMPRIGFAYQVTPRFVLRGGYGITTYLEGTGANLRLTQNPPFHNDFDSIATVPAFNGGVYSPGTPLHASSGFPTTNPPVTTFYAWKKNLQPASIQEASLTTEYELTRTSSLQVGFVSELGHHLTDPVYANQLASPTATAPYASVVGQGGVVKVTDSQSAMNYEALQVVFRQHVKAGLELTANYSYAKSLTDDIGYYGTSNTQQQYYQQNAYDLADEWGPSGSDVRHALSVTGTYQVPFGRGQRFGNKTNFALDELLGGWKLSGTNVTYSGFPVTVTSNANYSNLVFAYTGAARPDQINPVTIHNRSVDHWFGTDPAMVNSCGSDQRTVLVGSTVVNCVYASQSANHFGSVRPGTLRAPGFLNFDFALQKSFRIYESHRLDFRSDFFNAFNIASYGNPDNSINDPNFGQITSTRSTERHIQFELKYAF